MVLALLPERSAVLGTRPGAQTERQGAAWASPPAWATSRTGCVLVFAPIELVESNNGLIRLSPKTRGVFQKKRGAVVSPQYPEMTEAS
jgi:hypothetical protein